MLIMLDDPPKTTEAPRRAPAYEPKVTRAMALSVLQHRPACQETFDFVIRILQGDDVIAEAALKAARP